ncbi:MAG TPA: SIS domain-containing protein [Rhizomicrobium sp.]|jgi:D-sedoheptulose 7-phosphate isomerase|nr:SIS domain-containing protein [Rhizomicrobium sp.]
MSDFSSDAQSVAYVRGLFIRSVEVKRKVIESHCGAIVEIAKVCAQSIAQGGKLLLCGNGGSAADAQHLAAELLVRLRPNVNRSGIAAIPLAIDSSSLTACGNDYSYEVYFERMTRALGREGDVLMAITTSGKSPNVLAALKAAREMDMKTVGFLGGTGGPALPLCDVAFVAPSDETGRIQESHITAGHAVMELVEDMLLAQGLIAHT